MRGPLVLAGLVAGPEAFRGDEGDAEITEAGGEGLALCGDRDDLAERVKSPLLVGCCLEDAHILLERGELILPGCIMRLEEEDSSKDEEDDEEDKTEELPEARIHTPSPYACF